MLGSQQKAHSEVQTLSWHLDLPKEAVCNCCKFCSQFHHRLPSFMTVFVAETVNWSQVNHFRNITLLTNRA